MLAALKSCGIRASVWRAKSQLVPLGHPGSPGLASDVVSTKGQVFPRASWACRIPGPLYGREGCRRVGSFFEPQRLKSITRLACTPSSSVINQRRRTACRRDVRATLSRHGCSSTISCGGTTHLHGRFRSRVDVNNAAMDVQPQPDSSLLVRCSDGWEGPDFNDLVFQISKS
jgi:hypothetical protein